MSDRSIRVREVLADVFGIPPENITRASSMNDLDGWDSFSHIQAIAALEAEFGVSLPTWRIPEINTVEKIELELEALGIR